MLSKPGGVFSRAMSRLGTWVGEHASEGQEVTKLTQTASFKSKLG